MKKSYYDEKYIDLDGNKIHDTAIIGDNVELGQGNVIQPYAVIGSVGFIREEEKTDAKVIIGDNNNIGIGVCIQVGEEGDTVIGSNNLIMHRAIIGHNVKIADDNEIGANCVVCGYSTIGNYNKIKTSSNIRNRITIGDHNLIGMGSNVVSGILDGFTVMGNPAKAVKTV